MKQINFYFDFISPYAYLAFEQLPEVLMGLSYSVNYKPVLFGALLEHHGQLGPAEIEAKRDWSYRQVLWLAHKHGVELQLPAAHPFNPLPLLRLAVASNQSGLPNRYVTETLFHHVWRGGADAADPARIESLVQQLGPTRDLNDQAVKAQLKAGTGQAIGLGVFGVPTMEVDGRLFWGFDALPMVGDYLRGDAWFSGGAWESVARVPAGISRRRSQK